MVKVVFVDNFKSRWSLWRCAFLSLQSYHQACVLKRNATDSTCDPCLNSRSERRLLPLRSLLRCAATVLLLARPMHQPPEQSAALGFPCSPPLKTNTFYLFLSLSQKRKIYHALSLPRHLQTFSEERHQALRKLSLKEQHVASYSLAVRCHLEHQRKNTAHCWYADPGW